MQTKYSYAFPHCFFCSTRYAQKHPPCLGLTDLRDFWQEEGMRGVGCVCFPSCWVSTNKLIYRNGFDSIFWSEKRFFAL